MNLLFRRIASKFRSKPPTVLVINDTRDVKNYGLQAVMTSLEEIFSEAIPRYELRSIPNHWIIDASFGFDNYIGDDIWQPEVLWPRVADQFEYVADEWIRGRGGSDVKHYLVKLEGVDVVVFNAEHNVYRSNLSAIRALFLMWFAKTKLDIPGVFLNGTVHLSHTGYILPAIVRKTFKVLDNVAVREPYSLRNLNEYLPNFEAKVIPDSVFYQPEIKLKIGREMKELKDLEGTDFFCFGSGAIVPDHEYGDQSALYYFLQEIKAVGFQAVLVAKDHSDLFLKEVAVNTDSIFFSPSHSHEDLMSLLAQAKFQITGRYHLTCLATIVGCPTIVFAGNSHKNQGLCELMAGNLGQPYDNTDLRSNIKEIKQQAKYYVKNNDRLRVELQGIAKRFSKQTLEMGNMVKAAIDSKRKMRSVS